MTHSEQIAELAAALAAAQGEIEPASKDAINPHFKNRYADIAAVFDAIRGPLAKHGLAVLQFPGQGTLATLITHKSGQWLRCDDTPILPRDGTSMAYGAALTYSRRQALQSILGVASEDDDTGIPGPKPTSGVLSTPRLNAGPSPAPLSAPKPNAPVSGPTASGAGLVTTAQITKLFTAVSNRKEVGWNEARLRLVLGKMFGLDSTKLLAPQQFDAILHKVEKSGWTSVALELGLDANAGAPAIKPGGTVHPEPGSSPGLWNPEELK